MLDKVIVKVESSGFFSFVKDDTSPVADNVRVRRFSNCCVTCHSNAINTELVPGSNDRESFEIKLDSKDCYCPRLNQVDSDILLGARRASFSRVVDLH